MFNPSLVMYNNMQLYRTMFKIKRKIPMMIVYNMSKVFGTKSFKEKIFQLKDAIDKTEAAGFIFEHFTLNQWIFTNDEARRTFELMSNDDKALFNFDVSRIEWNMFTINNAYGIRRFVLKEEAELPSAGYNDVVTVYIIY